MKSYRALLVDDEVHARKRMSHLLSEHTDHIEIVGEANSVASAISMMKSLEPDLLFLDIKLGDGDAFDVLQQLVGKPHVIFATAYSEYAHKAFEHRAIDYLLKPVTSDRLALAIDRLPTEPVPQSSEAMKQLLDLAASLRSAPTPISYPVRLGDRTIFVRFDDITHFEAKDKVVYLHTVEKKSYPIDRSLTQLQMQLPKSFIQVHRAYILNRTHLVECHRYFSGKYKLILGKPMLATIESGVTYKSTVEDLMNSIDFS
jgi:two-component system LytT family response regulator